MLSHVVTETTLNSKTIKDTQDEFLDKKKRYGPDKLGLRTRCSRGIRLNRPKVTLVQTKQFLATLGQTNSPVQYSSRPNPGPGQTDQEPGADLWTDHPDKRDTLGQTKLNQTLGETKQTPTSLPGQTEQTLAIWSQTKQNQLGMSGTNLWNHIKRISVSKFSPEYQLNFCLLITKNHKRQKQCSINY